MSKLYLRIREVADALDVSPRTVERRIADGTIPVKRIGRLVRIPATFLQTDAPTAADAEDRHVGAD